MAARQMQLAEREVDSTRFERPPPNTVWFLVYADLSTSYNSGVHGAMD